MASLEELYARISSGQDIAEVTNLIFQIYENPQSILEILRIISQQQNQYIRNQASIQLRIALDKNWPKINQSAALEQIKLSILEVLSNEPIMLFRDSIIHSMDLIINKKSPWPQLGQFIQNLLQTNVPIQIETALKVLFIWLPSFKQEEFVALAPTIGQNIVLAISSDSVDIQIAGFNVLQQSIPFFQQPLVPPFSDALVCLFKVFQEMMIQMNDKALTVGDIIEHVVQSNKNCIDPQQLIRVLLPMAINEQINPKYYFSIFSPLIEIVIKSPLNSLKPFINDIMNSLILCISKSLSDECYNEEPISLIVVYLIERINNEKLFNVALSSLTDNSMNQAYAAAVIFSCFLEYSPSVAIKHSAEIATRLVKYASSDCIHSLFEVSLIDLKLLIGDTDNKMSDFFDPIIKICFKAISTNHPQLIINALDTLTVAISSLDFNQSYLEELAPKISQICASGDITISSSAIPALSALIEASEKDIIPYIPLFLPILVQAAQVNEKAHPELKGEALEALALLISVAPNETASIISPVMNLFMECTKTNDSAIVAKLLSSFSFLASAKFNGIETVLPTIVQFSIAQLDLGQSLNVIIEDDFDPSENPEFNQTIVDSIINALTVICSTTENAPQILLPCAAEVAQKVLNFTVFKSERIVKHAIDILALMIVTYKLDPNKYIADLTYPENIFEDSSDINVAAMFDFGKTLIESNCSINQDYLGLFYMTALQAIQHKLPLFEMYEEHDGFGPGGEEDVIDDDANEQSEFDIVESVFRFLSIFIAKYIQIFNAQMISKLVDSLNRAQKKKFILEVMYGTDILGQLFELNRSIFSGLVLKFSLNIIKNCLLLVDGTYKPCPLDSIRRIISTDISVIQDFIPQIIEKTNSILTVKNEGHPFYKETLSSAVSVLFALLKIQGQQFPLNQYFPIMLSSLPSKYNAEFIYGSLVMLYLQAGAMFNPFSNELIRVLAQTLSLKDSQLQKYNFSQDVSQNLLKMLLILIQTNPNGQQILQQAVPNPNSQEILRNRLSSASAQ